MDLCRTISKGCIAMIYIDDDERTKSIDKGYIFCDISRIGYNRKIFVGKGYFHDIVKFELSGL